jgi:CRP/FNR family cyclic AMP-dependent transcriptional regulator
LTSIQSGPHLKNIDIFLNHCRRSKYNAKTGIVNSGDQSDTLFYIMSGSVAAVMEDNDGKEVTLAYLNPGDFVGEMGLFGEQRRSACIRAKSNCELAEISYNKFISLTNRHPEFLFAVGKQVAKRLRNTSYKVRDLALLDVSGRVARTLLHLCQEPDAIALDKGVKIRITRQEIAKLIGCSREMVGRVLRELEANRLISVSGKTIVVFNKSRQRLLIMH